SGRCPSRLYHSVPHVWNGTPEMNWSLQELASHMPRSIGSDRRTVHSVNAAVAHSPGCVGSNGTAGGAAAARVIRPASLQVAPAGHVRAGGARRAPGAPVTWGK